MLKNVLIPFFGFAAADSNGDSNFAIVSCNEEKLPQLTFQIKESFFDSNEYLTRSRDDYELLDGWYQGKIEGSALSVDFSETDVIKMSHTVDLEETSSNHHDNIIFSQNYIKFTCEFARTIDTIETTFTVGPLQEEELVANEIVATGQLSYSMSVDNGELGSMTTVTINSDHNLENIYPRLTECSISFGDNIIWPVHSFKNDAICFDQHLNAQVSNPTTTSVEFQFRVFRFRDESSNVEQTQQINCKLYLEETTSTYGDQPCDCYTAEECGSDSTEGDSTEGDSTETDSAEAVLSLWTDWSSCSLTCGSGEQTRTRTCDQNCDGVSSDDLSETQDCNESDCPVSAVLMLSTRNSANKPVLVDLDDGTYDENLPFQFGLNTDAALGCGAILNGEMWYFGGYNNAGTIRQMSKINGCQLERQPDLPFDFMWGACGSFSDRILLCFHTPFISQSSKECHIFDGVNFQDSVSSTDEHTYVQELGNYRGNLFTTGSYGSLDGDKTEILDLTTLEWSSAPDYPYESSIYGYSTAHTSDSVFIIGGSKMADQAVNHVAQFKDNVWSQLGTLNYARQFHGSIMVGDNTVMVIGGVAVNIGYDGPIRTEIWNLEDGSSTVIQPDGQFNIDQYSWVGNGLYPVEKNFCKN